MRGGSQRRRSEGARLTVGWLPLAALLGLALLGSAAPLASVLAGPPEGGPPPEDPSLSGVELPPPSPPEASGFWLSVELIGARGAQLDAVVTLRKAPVVDALPRGGSPPPGELVGRVDTLADALSWVNDNAFVTLLDDADASPVPGGHLYEEHGVYLTALIITGAAGGGTQAYPWPPAAALEGASERWRPASLTVERAPLFAAPASAHPPASERYRVVEIDDSIWLLDTLERCDAEGACMRWAQLISRRQDRFFGGYVPASLIVPDDSWVGGPGERRFALLASHRTRDEVNFALIEQRGERREAPLGLDHLHAAKSWPSAGVEVIGEELIVTIGGRSALTRHLDTPAPLAPPTP